MKTDTFTSYLLPIAMAILRDDAYAKQSNLQDAAVEAIGAVCQCLPWSRYQVVLKYYLKVLPKSLTQQKLMVR